MRFDDVFDNAEPNADPLKAKWGRIYIVDIPLGDDGFCAGESGWAANGLRLRFEPRGSGGRRGSSERGVLWWSGLEEHSRGPKRFTGDVALSQDRQRGLLKLQELARLTGGVGYTAEAQAVRRVRQQIQRDKAWRRRIDAVAPNCQQ
jgi:hypothetical protein